MTLQFERSTMTCMCGHHVSLHQFLPESLSICLECKKRFDKGEVRTMCARFSLSQDQWLQVERTDS